MTATVSGFPYPTEPGNYHPLGATPDAGGVNFSLYSDGASGVELLLFASHTDPQPSQVVVLDPDTNHCFHYWHVYVVGLPVGAHYAYRVSGPDSQGDLHVEGHRFNRNKVLVDPYARGLTDRLWDRGAACGPEDNVATALRGTVVDLSDYDWEGDRPLNRPMPDTVIYELHVGGFTKSPSARVANPGTYAGLIEKIPYLQELGVTAVELMPVFAFDMKEPMRAGPDGTPLRNFWGYSPINLMSPHHWYCVSAEEATHVREFRDLVKALHRAGIEVILDVVFNHTSEGNQNGPTINLRGQDNSTFYLLEAYDRQYYSNYSGCGNTLNCNHPITAKMLEDCLEFWVREMHVDGFRFDEGSILSRGEDGAPLEFPPVPWSIELSETLAETKVIAEAWDAGGLYQVGHFPGLRWAEWNGRYRDDIRRFVKGDPGLVGSVAARIAGSADIYQSVHKLPSNSINFITCHDGFTLNDLVSYNGKHNEANGENNQDGVSDNMSWNCGVEGDTDDPAVQALRERQVRNLAAVLLLSQGVPMILGGDEVRRTQHGNNNAYCQDNQIGWFDWELAESNADTLRFFREMIAFRKRHPVLRRSRFFNGRAVNERGLPDVSWHGCQLGAPGWFDPASSVLAFTLGGADEEVDLHVMLNMHWEDLDFQVPAIGGRRHWSRAVDTSLPSPDDIATPGEEVVIAPAGSYRVNARSVVVLISKQ
jgi:glycogen operon protein